MTKENVRAILKMLRNLEEQRIKLENMVLGALPDDLEDSLEVSLEVSQTVMEVEEGVMTADEAIKKIGFLYKCEDGMRYDVPEIMVAEDGSVTVTQPVSGGALIAGICNPDMDGSQQATLMYSNDEGDEYDLAMAEVKRGELAIIDGKSAKNQDVDLYVWSDPSEEDYQRKYTLAHDSFC